MSESLIKAVRRITDLPPEQTAFDAEANTLRLEIVRTAVERLGWGSMAYQCDKCGFEWQIWLTLGVEGPRELRQQGLCIASPFSSGRCGRCVAWPRMQTCDGIMKHVRVNEDIELPSLQMIPDDAPRWVLPYMALRGDSGAELRIPEPALVAARRALAGDIDG